MWICACCQRKYSLWICHPWTNGKQWKNMEGPNTRCVVEDIEDRGGFTAEELVI